MHIIYIHIYIYIYIYIYICIYVYIYNLCIHVNAAHVLGSLSLKINHVTYEQVILFSHK